MAPENEHPLICAAAGTDLRVVSAMLRRWILEQSYASCVGHIGSALSVVEILVALWGEVLRQPGSAAPDRDRFILSKGHAALTLYCVLRWKNLLTADALRSYCRDRSQLGVHPECWLPGVDASTGSLGQGLSVGCGLAYGLRLQQRPARVFVLVSDAECNEGQVWEAAMFAAHQRLHNLLVVVDLNGMQALGHTRQVLDMASLAEKWRAFGWDAVEADGHDAPGLVSILSPPPGADRPRVVLARTVLGKGVSFMEHRLEWHYRNLTEALYRTALEELEPHA